MLVSALFVMSLDLVLGFAGIISLGHALYFGFGAYVTGLVTQKRVVDGGLKHVLIHSISDDGFMSALTPTSKYNADWDFLIFLRDQGRKCADDWLAKNFVKLGVESSVDIDKIYL